MGRGIKGNMFFLNLGTKPQFAGTQGLQQADEEGALSIFLLMVKAH